MIRQGKAIISIDRYDSFWRNLAGGQFFLTTPGFGHQIRQSFKIVPPALFTNLHQFAQPDSTVGRMKTVCRFQIGSKDRSSVSDQFDDL